MEFGTKELLVCTECCLPDCDDASPACPLNEQKKIKLREYNTEYGRKRRKAPGYKRYKKKIKLVEVK